MESQTKKTLPKLFPLERTKIIANRINQLERGAKTKITKEDLGDRPYISEYIALKELELNIIPIKVKRTLPDGSIEYWKTEEFTL